MQENNQEVQPTQPQEIAQQVAGENPNATLNTLSIHLAVPEYPFPMKVEIVLVPELESALAEEKDETRRNELMYNILFNMMTESMKYVVQEAKKLESGLILP